MKLTCLTILLLAFNCGIHAQEAASLTLADIKIIVTSIADSVNRIYVDETKGRQMHDNLLQYMADGKYNKLITPSALSAELTTNLVNWSNDKHFNVSYQPPGSSLLRQTQPQNVDHLGYYNYYLNKLEVLPGNIGYLNLKQFIYPADAGYLIASTMSFLANTNGIIIDLRNNIGGSPDMAALIAGYFFEKPVLFHSSHIRQNNITNNLYTARADGDYTYTTNVNNEPKTQKLRNADTKKLTHVPVFILTSAASFSSAELFAYNMQAQKRVTIFGEITGGGGNGIRPFRLPNNFSINIPFVAAKNPITNTGWEAVGVKPEVQVSAKKALGTAHLAMIDTLIALAKTEADKKRLQWDGMAAKALYSASMPTETQLQSYTGKFGTREFFIEYNELFQRTETSAKRVLTAISSNLFAINDITRIQFEPGADGKINQIKIIQMEGTETIVKRK
jgi:hypothetical protein